MVRFAARLTSLAAALAFALAASAARADPTPPDQVDAKAAAPVTIAPQPWLYLDDPTTPAQWRVTAFSRVTYTGGGASPTRPFGADVAHPGGMIEAGAEVGLTSWLSIAATGFGSTLAPNENAELGTMAGVRIAPT